MSLRQEAFSAVRWTATAAVARSLLQILQVAILTRLLVPEDYGLMAIVIAVMGFASIVSDLGVSSAIIHRQDTTDSQLSTLYWLNVLSGFAVMLLLVAASPLVAAIYGDPRLVPLLVVTSLSFPVIAIGHQLRVRAEKELRFGALARLDMMALVAAFGVAVAMAWAGMGVAALVGSLLTNSVVGTCLAWIMLARGWRPSLVWRLAEVKAYLSFGAYVIGNNIANTVNSVADLLIGGRILGPAALGLYSVPRNLALQVQWLLNPVVTKIAFPLMSRVQGDRARLNRIYLEVMRLTASVNAPIYAFLFVFAPEVTAILFGERWVGSAPVLRVLAIWGLLRSLGQPVGSLLLAVGRARLSFQWNLAMVAVVPIFLWVAAGYGVVGLAAGWVAISVLTYVPNWYLLVRPCCGAGFWEYTRQVVIPMAIAVGAAGAAYGATIALDGPLARLAVGGLVGGIAYMGGSAVFNRSWIAALRTLLSGRGLEPPTEVPGAGVG